MNSNNNLFHSCLLWCFAQVSFISATIMPHLEVIFKCLSIISVLMVIVINTKSFIARCKELWHRLTNKRKKR